MRHILVLGGTSDASALAAALARTPWHAVLSYAGRIAAPRSQPVPVRVGGFGGIDGLADYLRSEQITHVVDATHPFAAQMSANAVAACAATGTALLAFERPPWIAGEGDRWQSVANIAEAVAALAGPPQRIFLAIGRLNLEAFAAQPQHHYLLRLVDEPDAPLPLGDAEIIVARGPFRVDDDMALLRQHRIELVVAKNAGGDGARAKIDAARALGLPVLMIERPALLGSRSVTTLDAVMEWLAHEPSATPRGV